MTTGWLRGSKRWIIFAIAMMLTGAGSLTLNLASTFRLFSLLLAIPYSLAIQLLRRVVSEYEPGTRMRYAWALMMVSAGLSIVRHLLDFASSFANNYWGLEIRAISVVPALLSIVVQLLALILLWYSFNSLGIHRPFAPADWVLVGLVALLVTFCFTETGSFPHSSAHHAFYRYLEYFNPAVFAVSTVVGLMLYRLSADIGRGDMALSILFLVFQLSARFIGFGLETLKLRLHMPWLAHPSNLFYWSSPWLFLWGVLLREQIIERAMVVVKDSRKVILRHYAER